MNRPTSPTSFAHDAAAICDPYLAQVRSAETVRLSHHRREADRSRGVCISGMGPDAITPHTEAELVADADAARARANAYLTSNLGRARTSIAGGCRKAEALHAALQDIGTALSRGDGSAIRKAEDAAEVLRDLRLLVADAEAFVRLVAAEAQPLAAE